MKSSILPGTIVLVALSLSVYGCKSSETTSSSPTKSEEVVKNDHRDHDQGKDGHDDHSSDGQSAMEKMKAALANFSPEDRASAEKQHFCPVSGAMIGTMGVPIKVDVKGQQVWICCGGCKEDLLNDPDTFLAKLKKE